MEFCIDPARMRDMEQRFFAAEGVASIDLMERAASELFSEILRRCGDGRVLIAACGPGGNGGDGLACARMYSMAGGRAYAVMSAEPVTADCAENYRRAVDAGVEIISPDDLFCTPAPGIWVDALFGTGISRAPAGISADIIRRINADRAAGSFVFAADIPSGLDGRTGIAYEPCVRADVTVSFQFKKVGLVMADGLDMCGEIIAPDIGIPSAYYPGSMPRLLSFQDIIEHFPPRKRNSHKGTYGHLLIVAGSMGMAGAAAVCADAALHSGAGLVSVACPASIVPILQTLVPSAMCIPMPEHDGALADCGAAVASALRGKSAAVIGCGLSMRANASALKAVIDSGIPSVIDADGLNMLSADRALLTKLGCRHILTPHPGEAARLLGRPVCDMLADAQELSRNGCTVLLKNACSVISGSGLYLSASGCAGMAKGGSGDSLAGLLGALLAAEPDGDPALLAALASEIHGRAGEAAQTRFGCRGMVAMDINREIPGVFPC